MANDVPLQRSDHHQPLRALGHDRKCLWLLSPYPCPRSTEVMSWKLLSELTVPRPACAWQSYSPFAKRQDDVPTPGKPPLPRLLCEKPSGHVAT